MVICITNGLETETRVIRNNVAIYREKPAERQENSFDVELEYYPTQTYTLSGIPIWAQAGVFHMFYKK